MDTSSSSAMCPWCSCPIVAGSEFCVRCGAALAERPTAQKPEEIAIPGVTSIDPRLSAYLKRQAEPRKKRGLSSLLEPEPDGVADPIPDRPLTSEERQAIAPPPRSVREEMLRMEREALERSIAAEVAVREAASIAEAAEAARIADAASRVEAAPRAETPKTATPDTGSGTDGVPPAPE